MSKITFSVNISLPNMQGMESDILKEFAKHIDKSITSSIPFIKKRVETLVAETIKGSSTVNSLANGDLRTLLCLDGINFSVYHIENAVVSSLKIDRKSVGIGGNYINGGFTINILDDSYREMLAMPNSSYVTLNGKSVQWMEWLLFYGTSPVMLRSRLLKTDRGTFAVADKSDFYIPSSDAGTASDNFLTRSLQPLEASIGTIIEEEVSRRS